MSAALRPALEALSLTTLKGFEFEVSSGPEALIPKPGALKPEGME